MRALVRAAMWETFDDAGLERPGELPGRLRHELDHLTERYQAVLVAARDASPVGCVALRPHSDADTVVMNRLYVTPEDRRTGFGRQLAAAAIDRARELGYRRVVIDVIPQRTSVIRLYKALGFRDIEPFIDYPFPMVFLGVDA